VESKDIKNAPYYTVRDSFSMPRFDHDRLGELIEPSLGVGMSMNKGELMRAGLCSLIALSNMTDIQYKKTISQVEKIKTGRPSETNLDS
jgi:hypothetical protein